MCLYAKDTIELTIAEVNRAESERKNDNQLARDNIFDNSTFLYLTKQNICKETVIMEEKNYQLARSIRHSQFVNINKW